MTSAPLAAAARRLPTTKLGPTAPAPTGNHGAGPRLGYSLGGPCPHRGQPERGKGIQLGGTRKQARRPRHPAPATSQPVRQHGQSGTQTMRARLDPDLTPYPSSHDLATRLAARPFVEAVCRSILRRKSGGMSKDPESFSHPPAHRAKNHQKTSTLKPPRSIGHTISHDGSQQLDPR